MLASSNLLDPAATHGVSFSCTNATLFTSQRQLSVDPVECCTANLEGWLKYETKKTWQQEPEEAKLYSLKDKSETDFAKGHVRWQSFLGLLFKQYKRGSEIVGGWVLCLCPEMMGNCGTTVAEIPFLLIYFFFQDRVGWIVWRGRRIFGYLSALERFVMVLCSPAAFQKLAGESYSGRHNFRSMSFCCWCEYITLRVLC